MFGMSVFELMFVFVVALLVFGPDKLPELAKKCGKLSGEFKRHSDNFRREFYQAIYPPRDDWASRSLKSLPNVVSQLEENKPSSSEKGEQAKTEQSNQPPSE